MVDDEAPRGKAMRIRMSGKLMEDPRVGEFSADIECTRWLTIGYLYELYTYWARNCLSTNLMDKASLITHYALACPRSNAELGERIVETLWKVGFISIDQDGMVSLPDFKELFGAQILNRLSSSARMRRLRSRRNAVTE